MHINQISVFLENRIGQLAEVTKLLSDNHINLRAISIAESSDYGLLRIIVDDSAKAANVLLDAGNIITMNPVVVVAVPDQPAGLSEVLSLLSEGKIDIEYMYALFTHQAGKAYMVFRTENEDAFIALLESHGLSAVAPAELDLK
ncbi:MAG: ACT domain-containing protein [Clostridia bacterium]|nr:ACT domain-containing protein [Clostridia bacterium]